MTTQTFKSEMREVIGKAICEHYPCKQGEYQCGFEKSGCSKLPEISKAISSLLALIEKRLPKEKVKKRKFLCKLDGGNGVQCNKTCDENCKDAEDWGLEYDLGDDYFNQCLSEIKKGMGI